MNVCIRTSHLGNIPQVTCAYRFIESMAQNRLFKCFRLFMLAALAVAALMASEHHGWVTANGVPVPGATVTATQDAKKLITTTDDRGAYSYPDLADGIWTIQVDMLGFAGQSHDVATASDAPSPTWELQILGLDALRQQLAPPAPPATPAAAPAQTAANQPAGTPAPEPAKPAPAASTATPSNGAPQQRTGGGGRGGQTAANNGRPSLRQALSQGTGFQRLDVNQTADAQETEPAPTAENANSDAAQTSDALVVNGSVSGGLDMPQQNDWFGFGGRGGGGFGGPGGPGGPGGGDGFGGPGGLGGDGQPQIAAAGGRGGAGGPGGGGGPRGGGGGGFAGGGGFGGRGGRGGGGAGGNRQGRGPAGGNRAAFGNARRNPRMRYNGNLLFSLDNSALDARPFSLTGQQTAKSAYAKFRSSGMFGGPLKIPHLLSGQKTFFTVNYQLARQRNAGVTTTLVPTLAERNGDFSQALNPTTGQPVVIYDPLSGSPFTNNVIPQGSLSQTAQTLQAYYPLPNFSGNSRYNYQTSLASISNQSNINSRVSQTINAKNQVNGTFAFQHNNSNSPSILLNQGAHFVDTTKMTGFNTSLAWTYHFTTRLISNLRYNFSRSATTATPYFAGLANISQQAGIQGNYQSPQFYGPPSAGFSSGFAGIGDSNYALNHNNTNQVGDSLLWVHGVHNVTMGGDFRRLDFNQIAQSNPRGSFTFTGGLTALPGTSSSNTSGFDYADFLLGYPDASAIAYSPQGADKYFRASWVDAYVTDDWRVSTRLTLNVGVRWDFQAPVTELHNRLVNLIAGPGFATTTPVCGSAPVGGQSCTLAGQAGLPDALVRPNYHEFQPRIGFAWRPTAKGQTVVRGGYGLYYNTSVFQPLANRMSQQSPLSYSVTQSNSLSNLYTLNNAFLIPATGVTPQTFGLDPNFHIGYVHYWQLAVQQTLKAGLVGTLTYSGNKGTHQVQQFLPNTYPAGVPVSAAPHGFVYETSGGNSNYNSFSAQMQRRFRSGFSANASYVFSKAIDDAEGGLGGRGGGGGASYAQDWLNLKGDRGPSAGQRNHTFNLNTQYSTAMGTRGGALLKGWKGALAKDWNFSSNLSLGSGQLLTPTVANRITSGTGISGTERAEYLGGSLAAILPGYGFNKDAFGQPPNGEWGNAGRGIIHGPALFGLNGSAGRVFRVSERRSFDLRFDATNLLNHVVYTNWNTTLGSTQFGLPAAVGGMRTFQAILRFRF
jgi:trimeric autotransporter adhesin